jgi:hypothetical protein
LEIINKYGSLVVNEFIFVIKDYYDLKVSPKGIMRAKCGDFGSGIEFE